MNVTSRRWLAIAAAVLVIAVIEILSDSVLDPALPFPFDTLLVTGVVLVVAIVASRLAFRSIDALTTALHARNRELERANASARALHDVTTAIAALRDLDQILQATVDHALELLRADAALLVLAAATGALAIRARRGPARAFTASPPGETLDPSTFLEPAFRRGLLVAALHHGGRTLGWLVVGSGREQSYGVADLETLGSLAGQAAIAIEQDRVQRELREIAVRRERERIARDLHDGLAQVLGYVNTKSQAVEELLRTGRVAEASLQLGDLATAARSVYVDLRAAIVGLASPQPANEPLALAISRIAKRTAETAKLAVDLHADRDTASLRLSPQVTEQVLAILGEALMNVQKHARAGRVEIRLSLGAGGVTIEIADDGVGFDPDSLGEPADWPHFGRVAMAERSVGIGATVEWDSAPGRGTLVRLRVPVFTDEAVAEVVA
jgi:signal transduction histidine kinase